MATESRHRDALHRDCSRTIVVAVALAVACRVDSDAPVAASRESAPPETTPSLRPIALPSPRHGHRVERIGGGLLAFGGYGDSDAEDRGARETWWLAPGAESWQPRAPMKTERTFFSSAVVDGRVYAIGDGLERYDHAADRWTEVVPAGSLPRSHFAAAALGRTIWVLGGYPAELGGLREVDLATGVVTPRPSPPGFAPGDHFHVMDALGDKLHVIGGLDVATFEPRREHWVLEADGWRALASPPPGIWAKFAVLQRVEDTLWLFGDFHAWRFDLATGAWTPRAGLPEMLVMAPSVEVDGTIWVIGGMRVEGERTRVLLAYDVAADQWTDQARR